MNEELLINLVQGYKELYDLQDPHYDDQQRRDNIWKEIGDIMKESAKIVVSLTSAMAAWASNETLQFIEMYRNEPVIWNPKHVLHKNKTKVNDAWSRIADSINIPLNELKKKKESLMTTYRMHRKKKIQSLRSGMGEDEHYNPIWPFYEPLDAFLKDVYECSSVMNTEENVMESSSTSEIETHAENNSNCFDIESNSGNTTTKSKVTVPVVKRRSKNPPELAEASKEMANAFGTLNRVLDNKTARQDDDCDLYAKLLAKKLRKFPENEREEIMLEIDSMLINRRQNKQNAGTMYINRPSSSQSSYHSEWSSLSSPYNRPHSTQSLPAAYVTVSNQPPPNRPDSGQSIPSTYVTIPNQSPPHRAHSTLYSTLPNPFNKKPQTQRIQILSNDNILSQSYLSSKSSSPTQIQQALFPEQPVELDLPESDEMYNNLQSESTETQNIIYEAYDNA